MDLTQLIVVLIVVGVIITVIQNYVPIVQPWKGWIIAVIAIGFCLWLLGWAGIGGLHFGHR